MGEASYKAMRAAEMDDVIFSGNTERPARNHAEVSVLIDNGDRKAPAAFNELETLEVSRRIMREQGSIFRVNGREVRARDVAMLFADASTGSRSPALVHQGRIGEIIQARPDQRRRVLEEAAGISGLHARRHEAELRLQGRRAQSHARRRRHRPACRAGRLAQDPGAAGGALSQYLAARCGAPKRCCCICAGSPRSTELGDAERTKDEAVRVVAERTGEQAQASTRQAGTRRRAPGPARGRSQGRGGAAASAHRARSARARGSARQGTHRRTRPPARAIRRPILQRERTLAADADAALGAARGGGRDAQVRSAGQRRAA